MPKSSISKLTRNGRYSRLRGLGATRQEAKQGMDYSYLRFSTLVDKLFLGHTFAQAKESYKV